MLINGPNWRKKKKDCQYEKMSTDFLLFLGREEKAKELHLPLTKLYCFVNTKSCSSM